MKSKYYETLFRKGGRTTTVFNITVTLIISFVNLFFSTFVIVFLQENKVIENKLFYYILGYLLCGYFLIQGILFLVSLKLMIRMKWLFKFIFEHEIFFGIMTYCQLLLFAILMSLPFLIVTNKTNQSIFVCILIFFFFAIAGIFIFFFMAYKMSDMKWINYFTNPSVQIVSTGLVLLAGLIIRQDMIVIIAFLTSILICFASAEYLVAVIVKWRNPEYLEFPTKEAVEEALREGATSSSSMKKAKFGFWTRKAVWVFCLTGGLFYGAGKLITMTTNETYQKIYSIIGLSAFLIACISVFVLIVQYILYRKKRSNKVTKR